jgi:hypothetical protein
MCAWIPIALSVVSALQQSQTAQDQAKYTSDVNRNNAKMAEYAATDATRRGEINAQAVQRQTSQMAGNQRASYAAKGLDVAEGTTGDVIDQTNFFGQADANTARYNGKLDGWSKGVQAQNFNSAAKAATYNGQQASTGALLSGASAVAGSWYSGYGKPTPSTGGRWNGTDFSG